MQIWLWDWSKQECRRGWLVGWKDISDWSVHLSDNQSIHLSLTVGGWMDKEPYRWMIRLINGPVNVCIYERVGGLACWPTMGEWIEGLVVCRFDLSILSIPKSMTQVLFVPDVVCLLGAIICPVITLWMWSASSRVFQWLHLYIRGWWFSASGSECLTVQLEECPPPMYQLTNRWLIGPCNSTNWRTTQPTVGPLLQLISLPSDRNVGQLFVKLLSCLLSFQSSNRHKSGVTGIYQNLGMTVSCSTDFTIKVPHLCTKLKLKLNHCFRCR